MSIDSAKAFIEKLKTDEKFARQVKACRDKKERLALALDAGVVFTPGDMVRAVHQLADDDLEMVSGGKGEYGEDEYCEDEKKWYCSVMRQQGKRFEHIY